MSAVRAHRRLLSWIAMLALVLASVLPTVGHALASAQGNAWQMVCSAQGSKWVQAGGDASSGAPAPAHVLEHCPSCALHTPPLGPAPAAGLLPIALQLAHALPLAFLAAPRTLHAWVHAQPRAPPLFS